MFKHPEGECIISIKDKKTGEVLFELDGYTMAMHFTMGANFAFNKTVQVNLEVCGLLKDHSPVPTEEKSVGCTHDWTEYNGFTADFKFCKVCNERYEE